MPMMIIIVTIVAIFYGSIHSRNMEDQRLATEISEAKVVAANMVAYRNRVAEHVKLIPVDQYLSFEGPTESTEGVVGFLEMAKTVSGKEPLIHDWYKPFPDINGYITNGNMYVYYKKPELGMGPTEAGVQRELLLLSNRSNRIGIIVPTP